MGKVALALSAIAMGVAVLALTRRPPEPPRAQARAERDGALAAEVAELRREVDALKAGRAAPKSAPTPPLPMPARPEDAPAAAEGREAIEAIVDDAVERKTERVVSKLQAKQNKKPAMDVFAATLELTEGQRVSTTRTVVEGQREVHTILGLPTADGTNLLDQLVEIAAKGIAQPGPDHGFGHWIARVLTEKVPGTDETYGARIEAVKKVMRASFQREWTEAQYKEFEEWGVDPTEIQNVPGGPNDLLFQRIAERARQLGAPLPND